jgi:alpha-1,6-mannosyltransferase
MSRSNFLLILIGFASLLAYLAAAGLADLRLHTIEFVVAIVAAFSLYLAAVAIVLRSATTSSRLTLWITLVFTVLFNLILLPTKPTLSDDMFRYVWDGRVQAHGISPYQYPPSATALLELRRGDSAVWANVNRPTAVTVYPPGAQLAFAVIWRMVGDSVIGFKAAFVIAELIGAALLLNLLHVFKQPPERLLIFLWSPLLIFEVAQAGHLDGLMLLFLIAAFYARVTDRYGWLGASLGLATAIKLFPAILLFALLPLPRPWSWRGLRGAIKTLGAFVIVLAIGYLVYAVQGASPLGFLPQYFGENFNMGLAHGLFEIAKQGSVPGSTLVNAITFGGLAVLSLICVVRPAASGREALVRCVWLIGWFTLTTQNLFAWYLLWLLPLIVLLIEPGRFIGLKFAPMSAWLIFSGTIALSYLFFIHWRPSSTVQVIEFVPLYLMLGLSGIVALRHHGMNTKWRWLIQPSTSKSEI